VATLGVGHRGRHLLVSHVEVQQPALRQHEPAGDATGSPLLDGEDAEVAARKASSSHKGGFTRAKRPCQGPVPHSLPDDQCPPQGSSAHDLTKARERRSAVQLAYRAEVPECLSIPRFPDQLMDQITGEPTITGEGEEELRRFLRVAGITKLDALS